LSQTKLRSALESTKYLEKRAKTKLSEAEKTGFGGEVTRDLGKTKLRRRSVVKRPLLGFKGEKVVSKNPRAKVRSSKGL
jgi:CRISPR/Cas system CSM-associated protein Csm3 (group 7 of RAMP superfamily)